MKTNIYNVLCQKTVTCLTTFLCSLSTRTTARQIILHEGFFNEEPHHKKLWHSKLSKLDPQPYWFLEIMFYKRIIDRRKSCFDFIGITTLSLLGRFNMSVQLHFLNFLWEPSQLLNASLFSQTHNHARSFPPANSRCDVDAALSKSLATPSWVQRNSPTNHKVISTRPWFQRDSPANHELSAIFWWTMDTGM